MMKRKHQTVADELGSDEDADSGGCQRRCVSCEEFVTIWERCESLPALTHTYQATEARWTGRRCNYKTLHYPCCGEDERSFCTGAFVGSDHHPGKLQGGPHNRHRLSKGGLGGARLTWDCCKSSSTATGCATRPSGVFNTHYELCRSPEVTTIAGWLSSIKLLRQRIEAHVKHRDGAGPIQAPMSTEEEKRNQESMQSTLCTHTPAALYMDASKEARILLRLFDDTVIPAQVRRVWCHCDERCLKNH